VKGLSRDFTLEKYRELCKTLLDRGYSTRTVHDYLMQCNNTFESRPATAILRHDVDRKPYNALRMAELENAMGIHSTYYFRYPYTFKPEIMRKIRDLGHEVGYHYEVLAKAKGDPEKSIHLFKQELGAMREVCDIKTICMHGSPLSKFNNRDLWKTYDFLIYNITGEAFLSIHDILYFTDTGRSWDKSNNIRDKSDAFNYVAGLKTTNDLIDYIQLKKPSIIYLTIHPERWADTMIEYYRYYLQDIAINTVKKIL